MSQPPPQGYGQYPPQGPPQGQQGYQYPPNQQYPPPQQQGYYPSQGQGAPPPQGGYQQPPPGQYPPPQQGYYNYPPQGGPPPPQGYAPPPQGGQHPYGYPLPQQQGYTPNQAPYGAPPPGQPPYQQPGQQPYYPPRGQQQQQQQYPPYGQPPAQYGAPAPGMGHAPPHGAAMPGQPSPGYTPGQRAMNYNPHYDIEVIRKACKGFNTDEKALISVFTKLDPFQIESLNADYTTETKKLLVTLIEDKTRGSFEDTLRLLCLGPLGADVYLLNRAMAGIGTKEQYLDFILLGRSNADIRQIKIAYEKKYFKTLESALQSDLSGKTERLFMMVAAGTRQEDNVPVIPQEVANDVSKLHTATEGKMGTDEIQVCAILTNRNDNNLRAICTQFERTYHVPLEKVIEGEFSGHMKAALLYLIRGVQNKAKRDAQLIEGTMAGIGTKDEELAARIVQAHWTPNYMPQVKKEYQQLYKTDLVKRIKGETSSDFERVLVALVG